MNKTLKIILISTSLVLLAFITFRLIYATDSSQDFTKKQDDSSPPLAEEVNEALQRALEQRKTGSKIVDSIDVTLPEKGSAWETLLDLESKQLSEYGYEPIFEKKHRQMVGKLITLEGYIYPIQETSEQDFFILSYFPIQACFFCGGAGPESAVEINVKNTITFTNKRIKLKGKLQLNDSTPERLFYILNDAELIKY